jgi:hypothetical protein
MNEKSNRGGPSVGLLLLIPAAALVVRAATRHHQMMWDEIGGPESVAPRHRHGHYRFAAADAESAARDSFRLPPRIEWILDTWHTRAHQPLAEPKAAAEPSDAPSA